MSSKAERVDLKARFQRLAENDLNSDCEFIVGPGRTIIKGHKVIFSTASVVFQAMFFGNLREEKQIRVEDLDEDGFRGMKTFIYTGEISFKSTDQALSIFIAARKYMIADLTQECVRYVKENLQPSGVLKLLDFSLENVISEFNDSCREIIQRETKEVLGSQYFVSASAQTIEFILKCPSLNLDSGIDLLGHFERWALAEVERQKILENCVATSFKSLKKYLRISKITADDFVSRIEPSPLFTIHEKYAIALNKMKLDSKTRQETSPNTHQPCIIKKFPSSSGSGVGIQFQVEKFFLVGLSESTRCWQPPHLKFEMQEIPIIKRHVVFPNNSVNDLFRVNRFVEYGIHEQLLLSWCFNGEVIYLDAELGKGFLDCRRVPRIGSKQYIINTKLEDITLYKWNESTYDSAQQLGHSKIDFFSENESKFIYVRKDSYSSNYPRDNKSRLVLAVIPRQALHEYFGSTNNNVPFGNMHHHKSGIYNFTVKGIFDIEVIPS